MEASPPEPGSFLKRTVDREMIQIPLSSLLKQAIQWLLVHSMRCANITTDSRTFSSPLQKSCPRYQSLHGLSCPMSPASESSVFSNNYSNPFQAGIVSPFYEEDTKAKSPRSPWWVKSCCPKEYVWLPALEPVNGTLGNRVFADGVLLRISRWASPRLTVGPKFNNMCPLREKGASSPLVQGALCPET